MQLLCQISSVLLALSVSLLAPGAEAAETITLRSLLDEMIDRDASARLPEPAYTCRQASSYDRRSVSPDDPAGWMANSDWSQFLRSEKAGGRTEWVMLDADGPGCVTRFWSGGPKPKGKLRFYLDGAEQPVIEAQADDLVGGTALVGPPFSEVTARGLNLYLPIPYAKHCKVTYDGPNPFQTRDGADNIWYNINYRTYVPATPVESFTREGLKEVAEKIATVGRTLLHPGQIAAPSTAEPIHVGGALTPHAPLRRSFEGPGAIRRLAVKLSADDLESASRKVVLSIACDGEPTVVCPVGDFFGSGLGVNPYTSWWRAVDDDGWMTCYWVMPFQKSCTVTLENVGADTVGIDLAIRRDAWKWDDRSMYFHTNFHHEYPLNTATKRDWNYVEISGAGVYMGDTLAIVNPVPDWWGEGDEKIYVDGEKFPSHFGTGTEDYYGYAWGHPQIFSSPFHAQPRVDGPGNLGQTTNTRTRNLDAIPFQKSLRFDMEVWHWAPVDVAYTVATYWYGRPGAKANHVFQPSQAVVITPPKPKPKVKVEGAQEGEELKIVAKTGGAVEVQRMPTHRWSDDAQLWWRDGQPGDKLVLRLNADRAGKFAVKANFTKAVDYGIFRFLLDGKPLGEPIDFYNNGVVTTAEIALTTVALTAGPHEFTAEITGSNPQAQPQRHMLGLDYLRLEPQP